MPLPMPKPSIGRALHAEQLAQGEFVDAAAGEDLHLAQAASVEDPADLTCMLREIAAVQAHGADADVVARQARGELHDLACRGLGIVGVDQEGDVVGMAAREVLERLRLAVVGLDEGVRHGAEDRHAVALPREHGGGARHPGEIGGARRVQTGLGPMRAAQAEVHQQLAGRLQDRARGLAGDHGLEMQDVHDPRFHQLCLWQRRHHANDRLVGEEHRALRESPRCRR